RCNGRDDRPGLTALTCCRRLGRACCVRSAICRILAARRPRWRYGGEPMSFYRGMTCENVTINGDKGTPITAYVAKPAGAGPFPGVVLVHHLPGWSEFYIETTRRFAHHGYLAICANLYERAGEGNPDDVAAKVRADGGIPDAQMVGDTEAA